MSIFCLKMFKKSAKLQALVNKHLNILTYLTKMSKIGKNLLTNYKNRRKLVINSLKSIKISGK